MIRWHNVYNIGGVVYRMYQCVYLVGTPPLRRRTGMNMNRRESDSESWIILKKIYSYGTPCNFYECTSIWTWLITWIEGSGGRMSGVWLVVSSTLIQTRTEVDESLSVEAWFKFQFLESIFVCQVIRSSSYDLVFSRVKRSKTVKPHTKVKIRPFDVT